MFALAKRTLPSPISTLQPPGCSAYIWHSLQRRELGGWTSGRILPGIRAAMDQDLGRRHVAERECELGVGQPIAPGTTPTQVLSLRTALCSPTKIVLESPSVTEATLVREFL